ncbi:MAG: hypothetical protein H6Q17_2719 [Bacteroidetes bacterium]|nr:hypothetical protein [Bacteroidota bacterium]
MAKRIFLFSLLGVILLASCSVGTGESDYSPQMSISSIVLNGVTQTSVDTLEVGDVLLLSCVANGVSKPLTSVQITNESDYSSISFPDIASLDQSVLSKSDPTKGYFNFAGLNIYSFSFTIQYIVTKANKAGTKLLFVVTSTSQYSPMTYTLKLPAK